MTSDVLDGAAVDRLRSDLRGPVIAPGDPGYDEARTVFNSMIDKRPAVIAQCEGVEDVAEAIAFARTHGLEIAVRGGGHGVTGTALSEGGLVIDLRRMNTVRVDPDAKIAKVAGGATMSDLDRATQPHALAVTGGRASTTGVGGFLLGGGSGWLERRFGLMCDNLLAAELVTADGRVVHASALDNEELFWALHGGGGNFGVATEFTLGLHPLPDFSIALMLWPAADGPRVLTTFRDVLDGAPDDAGGGFIFFTGPPEPFVPDELVGRPVAGALVTWTGTVEDAAPTVRPLLDERPATEIVTELPYVDFQCMLDDAAGMRNYWSAAYLDGFPDEALDRFCRRAGDMIVPSPSQQALLPMGGAVAAADDDHPVPWRVANWAVHPFGQWEGPAGDARARAWARGVCDDLQPWSVGPAYLNFLSEEGDAVATAGRGAQHAARLAAVKAAYDPQNVFHLNHNIRPAG